jgi:hypothetical protein
MNWDAVFKWINYIMSGILALVGVVSYVMLFAYGSGISPALWVLPAYYIFFAFLSIASDVGLGQIGEYCKFLTVYLGKGLFDLYLGSLLLYYQAGWGGVDAWAWWPTCVFIAGILFMCMAVLNILFHFCGKETVTGKIDEQREKLMAS